MVLGAPDAWASRFIALDERLIERIAALWPRCLGLLGSQPDEDTITINLAGLLSKDSVVRRICHWVEYQFEPFGTHPNGAKFSKGKIDLAVLLDWERERYVAYECKRLNVPQGGKRNSLATRYVTEGMMRFMTEQYVEALPVGCMLGYVLDGNLAFARSQLATAIRGHGPLGLTSGPVAAASTRSIERFLTTHTRSTKMAIELRHALLPFSRS